MCVCEREREKEIEKKSEEGRKNASLLASSYIKLIISEQSL